MRKKTLLILCFVGLGVIALLTGIIVFTGSDKVKTIKVGNYTLKLGNYEAYDTKIEDAPILVLNEDNFYLKGYEDEVIKFNINNNELTNSSNKKITVINDDELELDNNIKIKYKYVGSKAKTVVKKEDNSSKKDTSKKDTTNNSSTKSNTSKSTKSTTKTDKKVNIKKTASLKLVNYDGGEFTMKIPSGWKVSKGGTGLFYGIRVYDPKDDRYQIFYILKEQPFYKSPDAESLYTLSRGYCPGIYIGGEPTTEQIFKMNNTYANKAYELQDLGEMEFKGFEFPYISNFNVVSSYEGNSILHNQSVDDKVLRATFNNGSSMNSGESEGLFNACVVDFGTLGYGNDQFSYYMAYNVSGITTPIDELINYESILLESLNSIAFSASYAKTTVDAINMQTTNALNVSKQLNDAYKSYNDAWSNRQKSYDIQSQKRSDATLGYERVYDTETGEIYKAYNGFMDSYKGNRYKTISDSQYSEKISGYIEK